MPQTRMVDKRSSVAHWRDVLRTYAGRYTKVAALGGDGSDISFEQSFSNLAHAVLRDAAPTLLDHEVGFQLLDRSDDNSKAAGVFAFKVGSQWLYAPVFFLRGDLKGHELLYMKSQDAFVPLKENWLNYILNRKPHILGDGVDRNSGQMGVLQPDFGQLSRSPHNKFSAADPSLDDMIDAVLPPFAKTATMDVQQALEEIGGCANLPAFLKQAGLDVIECLVKTCQDYPDIAVALDEFHGLGMVSEAIKAASARAAEQRIHSVLDGQPATAPRVIHTGSLLDVPHPIKTGALKVLTYDVTQQTLPPRDLSPEDAEKLLRDSVLIKDDRGDDEVSIPYHVRVEQKLTNPGESGLYLVLTKPGDFEKCYIVLHPQGVRGRAGFCTVIRAEGERNWINTAASEVWVSSKIEGKEFDSWWDDLPAADSVSPGRSHYVVLGARGQGSLPFRVTKKLPSSLDTNSYEVDFYDHSTGRSGYSERRNYDYDAYDWSDGQRIHLKGKQGSTLRANRGDLFVPEDYKLLKVRASKYDEEVHSDSPCCISDTHSSDPPPIRPGNLLDAELAIMQKTASLTIYNDGLDVEVNRQRLTTKAALIHLVRDHGFRESAARELLKQAAAKRKLTCRVKYANPYLTASGPTAPGIPELAPAGSDVMGAGVASQEPAEQLLQVPGMSGEMTDPNIYNPNTSLDRRDVGKLQQAVSSGQRELFDTAMIGSMLKNVRDDTMVDKYLGDLTKGLDRLGRIIFCFYWHGDSFADRYGKADMPELEDSLRNSFEALGDVILFLRQKSVEPYPEEGALAIDLSETANN